MSKMIGYTAGRIGSLAIIATLLGCGGPYDASVSGVVTFEGDTLPRGTVAFISSTGGPPAYGQVENDGSYEVRTGREEGLASGNYGVTVAANELPQVERSERGGPPPPGKPITPAWYRSIETSGLSFTVNPGSNEIDLALTGEAPPGWVDPRKKRRRR